MQVAKFNWKFALAVALLFSLPFSLISWRFFKLNAKQARQDSASLLAMRAHMTASLVQQSLSSDYGITDFISLAEFSGAGWDARLAQLAKLRAGKPDVYRQIILVNAKGREVGRVGGDKSAAVDYSKAPHFLKTMGTGMSFGVVEQQKDTPPVLVASEPVFGRDKKIQGIVITKLSLEKLANIISASRASYEEGESALSDAGGMLIADSRGMAAKTPGIVMRRELFLLWKKSSDPILGSGSGEARINGTDYLAGFARVSGTDWLIYELEPASIINTLDASFRARMAVLSGLTLVLCFAFVTERLAVLMLRRD